MLLTSVHTLGLMHPRLLQISSLKLFKKGSLAYVSKTLSKTMLGMIFFIEILAIVARSQRTSDSSKPQGSWKLVLFPCGLQNFQIRVGWWWKLMTNPKPLFKTVGFKTAFKFKDTCTRRQTTFDGFERFRIRELQSNSNMFPKVYIRIPLLIVRHKKF